MSEQKCAIIEDDRVMRRLMAKVMAIAVKEAIGKKQATLAQRADAEQFLRSDWGLQWAIHLGVETYLDRVLVRIAHMHLSAAAILAEAQRRELKRLTRKVAAELWAGMADNGCVVGEFYREAPKGMAKRVVSEAALAYQGPKGEDGEGVA